MGIGEGLLSPFRVLDLAEGGYSICGRILADLGADVIRIEPPRGSPSRSTGPFYRDSFHPEKSLFWMAYNLNKRGITLNLSKPDGAELFRQLVKKTDFLLESFEPGYMECLGLGWSALSKLNPRLIVVSMTPYGQEGPKAHYKSSDIMAWASSAVLYSTGDEDRPPLTIGYTLQATMQGGSEGAAAALIAHWYRQTSGKGQHVDVSTQEANIQLLQAFPEFWEFGKYDSKRLGPCYAAGTGLKRRVVYPCKDGYVAFQVIGGSAGPAESTRGMLKWMDEEGKAPEDFKKRDWVNEFDVSRLTQADIVHMEEPFARFLLTKTKKELWERSFRDRIILGPVNSIADLCEFEQLKQRDWWVKVGHPELGDELVYPGPFVKLSSSQIEYRRRAPTVGEHNETVYLDELGLSKKQLELLVQANVV